MEKIYEFADTVRQSTGRAYILPTYINDRLLEQEVLGYQTLNVYGREMIGKNLDTIQYQSMSKGKSSHTSRDFDSVGMANRLISSGYQTRAIVIEFLMKHDNPKDSLRAWSKLNALIHDETSKLKFGDDGKYFYYGTLSEVSEVESNKLATVNRITFDCLDPFKFTEQEIDFSFTNSGVFNYRHEYPIKIESVEILKNGASDRVKLHNLTNGDYIEFFDVGYSKKITINYDYNDITIIDDRGKNLEPNILITSDLEEFNAEFMHKIQCLNCDVNIKFRYRSL